MYLEYIIDAHWMLMNIILAAALSAKHKSPCDSTNHKGFPVSGGSKKTGGNTSSASVLGKWLGSDMKGEPGHHVDDVRFARFFPLFTAFVNVPPT